MHSSDLKWRVTGRAKRGEMIRAITNGLTRESTSPANGYVHGINHRVQFYRDDHFLVKEVSRYLGSALRNGAIGMIIATRGHLDLVAERLQMTEMDLATARRLGRYVEFDAEKLLGELMVDGQPDCDVFSKFAGKLMGQAAETLPGRQPRVALFGEMVDLLCARGRIDAAVQLEQLWNNMFQSQPFELLCGYSLERFDREGHAEALKHVCAQHSEVLPAESYLQLKTEQDRFRYVVCVQQEAEALKTEIRERQRAQEALVRAEKGAAVGRLAASIAHEINNPLTSLTNLLYLLQTQSPQDTSTWHYASLADLEVRRISRITKQMLSFYRDSSRPVVCKVSEIADSILELYGTKIANNRVSVHRTYATDGVIQGFPSELRQLFANVIGNAIEAAGIEGKVRLRISSTRSWGNPRTRGVRVCISDNGVGISPENRRNIFEPFFTTKGESGTGLGLWVCQGIVHKHRGYIRFRSSPQPGRLRGTTFSIFLPVRATERQAKPQIKSA